jgi:8-hydroxy-5-deazaflavin:NADPH oxidoreductase
MLIRILGRGPLAQSIVGLAERAGHILRWSGDTPEPPDNDELLDLLILAGSSNGVEEDLANLSSESLQNLIVVDAVTPTHNALDACEWISAMLPGARIVRAFASVPVQAFTDLLDDASGTATRIAVPLASDDRDAKALVGTFMRQIGVEPYDLGALAIADVIDPGGPLWGKALSQIEMLEAVGWLSGDG